MCVAGLLMGRYIALLQIHLNKRKFLKRIEKSKTAKHFNCFEKFLNSILKVFSSQLIIYIVPSVWFCIFTFIFVLNYGLHGFYCSVDSYFVDTIVHYVFVLMFYFFFICIVVFDLIMNIPLIFKCRWKKIFLDNDPFHFRLDIISFLFTFPLVVVWLFSPFPYLISSILTEINLFIGLWVSGIQALMITMLKKFIYFLQSFRARMSFYEKLNLKDVLQEEIIDVFEEFCVSEWSSENILLKKDIIEYKKSNNQERKKLCEFISKNYLMSSSPLEVNCPEFLLTQVIKKISANIMEDDLFNDVEKVLDVNLSDTISRFRFSSLYFNYLKDLETKNKDLGL
jgi:hypothetical protein